MTWARIVVGTDGSDRAAKAVEHAGTLAAATGASLLVVTAYPERPDTAASGPERVPDDIAWMTTRRASADELAQAAAGLARRAGAADVRCRAEPGEPSDVMLRVADDVGADLIVVGSKGMTSPGRFLLGSVPNNISHHAGCDVLIVRTD